MLANLYNVPSDYEELQHWSFSHQDEHKKIADAIFTTYGIQLNLYILDPVPDPKSKNFSQWTQVHQAAHTAFDAVLGIAGNDLSKLDYSKQDQVDSWARLHADEHVQAQKILKYPE